MKGHENVFFFCIFLTATNILKNDFKSFEKFISNILDENIKCKEYARFLLGRLCRQTDIFS